VRTLCTSQVFPRVNMKIIWSCVTGRVYCEYLLASCQHILSTLPDSLYVHAHVPRGAINPRSGLRASLRVLNTTVRNIHKYLAQSRDRVCSFLVSRPELVPWLQEQIAEQKRIDAETSGTSVLSHSQGPARSKTSGPMPDVQLVLPGDARKQRKQTKQIFLDKGEPMCRFSRHLLTFFSMPQRLK
jgi:hypothetical protein